MRAKTFDISHPGYADSVVIGRATLVKECPEACLAHVELVGPSGKVEAVAPCDANMCRFLIEQLQEALRKQN